MGFVFALFSIVSGFKRNKSVGLVSREKFVLKGNLPCVDHINDTYLEMFPQYHSASDS